MANHPRRALGKKVQGEMTDRIEGALDYIPALDRFPFYVKREAAERAAEAALDYLKSRT